MTLSLAILSIFTYSISISLLEADHRWIGLVLEFLIFIYSTTKKERELTALSLITSTVIALTLLSLTSQWPVPSILTTIVAGSIVWFRKSHYLKLKNQILNLKELLISLTTSMISITGVSIWFWIFKSSLAQLPFHLPSLSSPLLILFLIAFSAVNAFAEELLFRGVAYETIHKHLAAGPTNLIQAAAFGLLHYAGFPFGLVGMALGFIFGFLMGYLRMRTKGLFSPWLAHFITDLGIALILLMASK